jgi:putative spermidine/putrescine transport system permease protein
MRSGVISQAQSFAPAQAKSGDLKALLRRARRVQQLKAMALVAPLFLFLLVSFVGPIVVMLWQSVSDPVVRPILPHVMAELDQWHGGELPPEPAFAALITDIRSADADGTLARAATRLNYDVSGFRTLMFKTSNGLPETLTETDRATLLTIDKRWGEVDTWAAIRRAGGPLTDRNLLAALDLRRNADDAIVPVPPDQTIFVNILLRTFTIAAATTVLCLLIGFPMALLLARLSPGWANLVLFFVLLPFWTSILVRTLAWFVLLQREGIINVFLERVDVIDEPLHLMFNRAAVYVSLVHVFLPYMVLPLYSVMRNVPALYARAAASLGASPLIAFTRVYLPQVAPGVSAGCLLVFIQALGVYVTPAILGGADDQGIAYMIAFYTNKTINWGMSAALSLLLLTATLALYAVYKRIVGDQQLRMG